MSPKGKPHSPPTHVLPAEARFAVTARFALGGSRGSESPSTVPSPAASSLRGAGQGRLSTGEPRQTEPPGTCAKGTRKAESPGCG